MNIRSLLSVHPASTPLVRCDSRQWTTSQILDATEPIASRIAGCRVGLRVADVGEALRSLAVLDGSAEAVVLVAPSVPIGSLSRILSLSGVGELVADDPDSLRAAGIPNVVRRVEDLVGNNAQRAPVTSWILATSGTSGDPKLVAHTLETLVRTTKRDLRRGAEARWGLLYEWFRFAGLQVVLQSAVAGSTLLVPPPNAPLEAGVAFLVANECSHLSATPTMWRKLVMTPGADRLPLRQVTLGGEISDDRILAALAATFPGARVTHVYASTEAGVGFSVNDGKSGFPESFLSSPPAGVGLRIVHGRLHIRNEAMATTYVGSDNTFATADGWIDTGDNVKTESGRVFFLGRDSGIINVGGNKVHPEEVERVLRQYPGVSAARVFGRRSPIVGALVMAELVFDSVPQDPKAVLKDIKSHCERHLEGFKVPAMLTCVESIRVGEAGKLMRRSE